MSDVKQQVFDQLTVLLQEQGKNIEEYSFKELTGPNFFVIKNNGLKICVSLYGIDSLDINYNTVKWNDHKLYVLSIFDKLDAIYKDIMENNKEDEVIDIMCSVDTYLSKSILDHFTNSTNGVKITNPTMFSNMNIYMLTFKNLDTFKKFIESQLFYKISDII